MQVQFGKLLLRYLVFIGIPFLIAKRVEKILLNRLDPETKAKLNEELKWFSEIDNVSEKTQSDLGIRRGAGPVGLWFVKVFVLDFGIKVAIGTGIASTVWGTTADNAAANILKFGNIIL